MKNNKTALIIMTAFALAGCGKEKKDDSLDSILNAKPATTQGATAPSIAVPAVAPVKAVEVAPVTAPQPTAAAIPVPVAPTASPVVTPAPIAVSAPVVAPVAVTADPTPAPKPIIKKKPKPKPIAPVAIANNTDYVQPGHAPIIEKSVKADDLSAQAVAPKPACKVFFGLQICKKSTVQAPAPTDDSYSNRNMN